MKRDRALAATEARPGRRGFSDPLFQHGHRSEHDRWAGATTTLRFHFDVRPRVGEFFKAPRGRTAYEIVKIRWNTKDWSYIAEGDTMGPATGIWRGTFTVCRWEPKEVPPGATLHAWQWDKR